MPLKINAHILFLMVILAALGIHATRVSASAMRQDDPTVHGRYIATIAGCTSCHTPDRPEFQNPQALTFDQIRTLAFNGGDALDLEKFLAGGRAFDLGPAGVVYARNITPDELNGIGAWTDEQIRLALKSGVDPDGQTLFPVMPYHVYNGMADADVDAVIAFLRSVDAIPDATAERTVSTEGIPPLPFRSGIPAPDGSDPAARGAYLVNHVTGCTDCHTPVDPASGAPVMEKYLAGRQPYQGPWGVVYGGNITPHPETGIGAWSEFEIRRALIAGIGRDGRRLILMPWYAYAALTPGDADAVVFYLKNLLAPVDNEVPKASLNPEFLVLAPEAVPAEDGRSLLDSPFLLVGIGMGIVLAVSGIFEWLRRRGVRTEA